VEDLPAAKRLPVAAVDANPDQPRKGPPPGIEALAESIREYGLLQPIVVSAQPGGRYIVIAGHRRLAAFRLLAQDAAGTAWDTIPAIERDTDTADRLVLALLENLSREDLTDAEVIAGLSVLRDLRGWSQNEIARRLGVTPGWISRYFSVAGDADVSAHVQRGELTTGKAYEVVVARSPAAKTRALDAALGGVSRLAVRRIARDEPPPASANGAAGTAGTAGTAGATPPEPPAATAPPEAGVRDAADVAAALGMTLDLRETQLLRLFRAALQADTPRASLADFIRAARADLRLADAMTRTAPRKR
jgi:ParB/RepB/Spo0J family partition protein